MPTRTPASDYHQQHRVRRGDQFWTYSVVNPLWTSSRNTAFASSTLGSLVHGYMPVSGKELMQAQGSYTDHSRLVLYPAPAGHWEEQGLSPPDNSLLYWWPFCPFPTGAASTVSFWFSSSTSGQGTREPHQSAHNTDHSAWHISMCRMRLAYSGRSPQNSENFVVRTQWKVLVN